MTITAADLAILSRLLDEAAEVPKAAREAWLAALPAADQARVPMLREMLAEQAAPRHPGFLHALPKVSDDAPMEAESATVGAHVGPYRLIREIGRGGMGTVWLAHRENAPTEDFVALKLPHLSVRRNDSAERLERERAILAALDHPGITKLLDAGADEQGLPFLVLEYVKGEPIDDHCRRQRVDLRARLGLFVQAASAVAYAHRRQVLHRDLKPANVLVTADGTVRLLDFGIATLLCDEWSVETALTRHSGRPLTLEYASPEQLRGEPAGIASDVYSLGVMLYELLCATRPHCSEGRSRAMFEAVATTAVPRRPSEVTAEPALRQALHGALDAVVMKALRKPACERYRSVEALVDDVQRFLDHRPVCAMDEPWSDAGGGALVSALPARDVILVGRQIDRAAVADLLRARRLVCIVGPGGVGKTELARAVASSISDDFADGATWVDLAALTSEAQLVPSVAAAAGVQLAAGHGHDGLLAALASRHRLLLLDNCEHLRAPVAAWLEAMFARAPALRVLATSREPLRATGETVYRLEPLPSPPGAVKLTHARDYAAFQLLERCVARADLGFRFDDRLAPAGAEICRELDGVPLAIEMAAVWVPKIGIEGVREMLHERLRMLRFEARGPALRQRSLRDVLDWSYGLLTPAEQMALRRLSAFAGPFDIELAEQMIADECTDRWCARELLVSLVDKSLVSVGHADVPRYRLLETTRLHAIECVQRRDESSDVRQRHGRVMSGLAQALADAPLADDEGLARFERHYADFECAFERACGADDADTAAPTLKALRELDFHRGVAVGMPGRLVSAARLLDRAAPLARTTIFDVIASCGWIRLPSISRSEAARQAVLHWRTQADQARMLHHALCILAINAAIEGSPEEARAALQEALGMADAAENPQWRLVSLVAAAHTEGFLGDARACLEKLRAALPLAVASGRRGFTAYIQVHLIEAAVNAGEASEALAFAPDMIRRMRALGQREYLLVTCHQMARAGVLAGRWEEARVALAEALALAWEFNRVREFLELLADFALGRGLFLIAARLSGFARKLEATAAAAALGQCRATLDPTTLERALEEGALMSNDACRELAVSVLSGRGPPWADAADQALLVARTSSIVVTPASTLSMPS